MKTFYKKNYDNSILKDFVQNIEFRYISPMDNIPPIKDERLAKAFQFANTILPYNEEELRSHIDTIWDIPKMSTFAIGAIINKIVSCIPDDSCYLNVGVWNGYSFFAGIVGNPGKRCIGVDNFSQFGGPREQFIEQYNKLKNSNTYFYDIDYKEYLSKYCNNKIGLYFYDGSHDYNSQLDALKLASHYFVKGTIILVDDTNWPDPYKACLDFLNTYPGDYRIILDECTLYNGHPTFWNGLLILLKMK